MCVCVRVCVQAREARSSVVLGRAATEVEEVCSGRKERQRWGSDGSKTRLPDAGNKERERESGEGRDKERRIWSRTVNKRRGRWGSDCFYSGLLRRTNDAFAVERPKSTEKVCLAHLAGTREWRASSDVERTPLVFHFRSSFSRVCVR